MFLRFRVQQVLVSPAEETNVFWQIWQVQLPDGPSTLPLQLVRRLGNPARLASHESSNLIKHIQDIERYQIPFGKCFYLIGSLSRSRKFANFRVFRLAFGRAMAHGLSSCDISAVLSFSTRHNQCVLKRFCVFTMSSPCFPMFFPGKNPGFSLSN